jgi:hypothetical protein
LPLRRASHPEFAVNILLDASPIREILAERFNLAEGSSRFSCRLVEPGIISYLNTPEADVVLIRKETYDRALQTAMGNPLTIDHIAMDESVSFEEVSNGKIDAVRYNAADGWFWVDGVVDTDQAKNLMRRGHRPSCAFKEKKVAVNTTGLRYHGFHYDKEITELEFHHLAIVKKPRFEEAIFRLNSIVPPTMKNIFTLLRNVVSRKNKADGSPELDAAGKEITESRQENIELSPDTEVTIGIGDKAKTVRLNELGRVWMDATAGVISDESEIEIPECDGVAACKVRVNALKAAYVKNRKNEAESEAAAKKKKEDDDKETARVNALSVEEKKAEVERKNQFHITLKDAERRGNAIQTEGGFSTTSGSLRDKCAEGAKRY